MEKVWFICSVVCDSGYDGEYVAGVFTSKEKAEEAILKLRENEIEQYGSVSSGFYIEEVPLDKYRHNVLLDDDWRSLG